MDEQLTQDEVNKIRQGQAVGALEPNSFKLLLDAINAYYYERETTKLKLTYSKKSQFTDGTALDVIEFEFSGSITPVESFLTKDQMALAIQTMNTGHMDAMLYALQKEEIQYPTKAMLTIPLAQYNRMMELRAKTPAFLDNWKIFQAHVVPYHEVFRTFVTIEKRWSDGK